MARVELDVYCVFTAKHKKITTSTVPAEFYGTISREMKINNVDTAYDERGQLLGDGNNSTRGDEKTRNIRDLVNGDSVWVRNSSKDKRTADGQKVHLVVIGPATVGKSALTFRFQYDNFIPEYEPTVEDFWSKEKNIDGQAIQLEILDTAGLEEYNNLDFGNWVNDKNGLVLVYSLIKRATWTDIRDIHYGKCKEELDELPPTLLIGNKKDLAGERKVETSEVANQCEEWGIMFEETSAKTDDRVVESFVRLIRQILVEKNMYKKPEVKFCRML